eukprot:PhM_4_TR10410/c1_g1_i2/m.73099
MGCGSSKAEAQTPGGARPRPGQPDAKGNGNTNPPPPQFHEDDDEDSPTLPPKSAFETNTTQRPALSVTSTSRPSNFRLPAPQPEVQVANIVDELFEFDDCKVLVSEVLKLKQERQMRVRRPLAKSKAAVTSDGEDNFRFGDFEVSKKEDVPFAAPMLHNYHTYTLLGHSTRVKCIALSPQENQYVSCSNEDSSLTLWDRDTGREVSTFLGHEDTILCVAFSPDNKYLATCSRDNHMILWDGRHGEAPARRHLLRLHARLEAPRLRLPGQDVPRVGHEARQGGHELLAPRGHRRLALRDAK